MNFLIRIQNRRYALNMVLSGFNFSVSLQSAERNQGSINCCLYLQILADEYYPAVAMY